MVQKWKKKRTIADEVRQTHYENMAPIYETINSAKSGDSHNDNCCNFGIMRGDNVYENIHSQETKCCQNASPKIATETNVAYMSSEIPMQSNDSYQAACTITKYIWSS